MKKFAFLFLSMCLPFLGMAQMPHAILTRADVDKFIRTFTPMMEELDALDIEDEDEEYYEDEDEEMGLEIYNEIKEELSVLMDRSDVMSVLKKYGWDKDYLNKYVAIGMAYSYLQMEKYLDEMEDEHREYYEEQLKMSIRQMKTMIHDDDIALVKPRFAELQSVFEDDEDEEDDYEYR